MKRLALALALCCYGPAAAVELPTPRCIPTATWAQMNVRFVARCEHRYWWEDGNDPRRLYMTHMHREPGKVCVMRIDETPYDPPIAARRVCP